MSPRRRHLLPAFALALLVLSLAAGGPLGGLAGAAGSELATASPLELSPRKPRAHIPRPEPKPSLGEQAASVALRAVGVPYSWGGMSPSGGFDCSGLVSWAYRSVGIELPHSSYALYGVGRRVARAHMLPGDVLFFSGLGHVGLYLGDGRMVHAPYTGRRVEIVRLGSSHYGGRLVGARRVVPA